jgi:hypothetical protein
VDRGTRTLFAILLGAIIIATAVAALLLGDPGTNGTIPPDAQQMTGVVVAIDSAGLGDVRSFVLRRPGGELVEFSLREFGSGSQFPPGHLAEHQATSQPITVTFRMDGDEHLALSLEDAPRASASA